MVQQQHFGEGIPSASHAVTGEMLHHLFLPPGTRITILRHKVIGNKAHHHIVPLFLHGGQRPGVCQHHPGIPPDSVIGITQLSLGVHRRRKAMPFTCDGDSVVPVFPGLFQQHVPAPGEQIMIDQTISLGNAHPGSEVRIGNVQSSVPALVIVRLSALELKAGQGHILPVHRFHVAVNQVQILHILQTQTGQIDIRPGPEVPGLPICLQQLADAHRECVAAPSACPVNIDQEGNSPDPVLARHLFQSHGIFGVPAAHVPSKIPVQLQGITVLGLLVSLSPDAGQRGHERISFFQFGTFHLL